jgi:tyrosine-specific transport protein
MKSVVTPTLLLIVVLLSGGASVLSFLQRGSKLPPIRCIQSLSTKSSLNDDGTKDSRFLDATFLISGTTIGAGILALPEIAREPGFIPSTLTLVICWIFMSATGLLLAEVAANLRGANFSREGDEDVYSNSRGILSMVGITLGRPAALVSGGIYLFFHYTLLCAYISEAGLIIDENFHTPTKIGALIFTSVSGSILLFGSEKFVGKFNDVSLLVVILSFLGLVCILSSLFNSQQLLAFNDFASIPKAVPIMFLSLVYHNVIPVISEKLKYDRKSITNAILIGTFIPLFMFVLWIALILGIKLPVDEGSLAGMKVDPVMLLRINPENKFLGPVLSLFSEFAISTSFTGFVLGLINFFKDIFPNRLESDPFFYVLILLPPLIVSLLGGSDLFLSALDAAGTYGITFLFGVLPVFMVLRLR